jgi:hypothetical protein
LDAVGVIESEKDGLFVAMVYPSYTYDKAEGARALQQDEATLNTRLQTALRKLKDTRPDLFQITLEEQLGKHAVELAGSFIKYILE